MAHEKIRGFVLREVNLGEADRLVEILTADRGLVTALARGARRSRSPLIAATQIFSLAVFTLFSYKGRLTIDSAELIEPFMRLQEDLDRLVCAAHLSEVFHDLVRDDLTGSDIYALWAYACNALQSHADPFLAAHIAQFRALVISGFAPRLAGCLVCGRSVESGAWFDFGSRGLICANDFRIDRSIDTVQLSTAAISCLLYCQTSPVEKLFAFRLDQQVRDEICRFSEHYLSVTMEKKYQKLAMLLTL